MTLGTFGYNDYIDIGIGSTLGSVSILSFSWLASYMNFQLEFQQLKVSSLSSTYSVVCHLIQHLILVSSYLAMVVPSNCPAHPFW